MKTRRQQAREIRHNAADLAADRPHPRHENNGEEFLYRRAGDDAARPTYLASFTKGLPHNEVDGLVQFAPDPSNLGNESTTDDPYAQFVLGIQSGDPDDFRRTPLGPPGYAYASDPNDKELCKHWKSQMAGQASGHRECDGSTQPKPDADDEPRCERDTIECHGELEQCAGLRAWESAGAGHVFDLEGPDAQAITMPPAPRLDSEELCAEMAEVYLMALLRDVPFPAFRYKDCRAGNAPGVGRADQKRVREAIEILRAMPWFDAGNRAFLDPPPRDRNRSRPLDRQTAFRGITPGDELGPYISQFLLVGSRHLPNQPPKPGEEPSPDDQCYQPQDGYIQYGAITIDQRVRVATPGRDFMTTWEQWLDVQNGANLGRLESYAPCGTPKKGDPRPGFRFMLTPRDLATYVHYDALYEAYLNACILMLAHQVPFDRGIPFQLADNIDKQQGFAHFGGPHILTLVTEVATRALKAVRFQKFNVHRRARPEQLGGLLHRWMTEQCPSLEPLDALRWCLGANPLREQGDGCWNRHLRDGAADLPKIDGMNLLAAVAEHNADQNTAADRSGDASAGAPSFLLPMAFPEGSPMHPAYGAGHATVAGACVTVLKAYFDHGFPITEPIGGVWEADPRTSGRSLRQAECCGPLTVEGELNKLASNISIGRDWAGVHYFTDYIESIRLGEQIALGLLEEQKLTYRENFRMTVPLFSGEVVRI